MLTGVFVGALQEYQDHPSDEDDGDLYEKIGCTDAARDERFGSGLDKRRGRLDGGGVDPVGAAGGASINV